MRAPQTSDPASPDLTNQAHARIHALVPFPDGSGRLALTDLRGIVYVTDESGADPSVYLDLTRAEVGFDNTAFPNEAGLLGLAFHPQFGRPGTPGHGRLYTAFSAAAHSGEAHFLEDSANVQESVIREWTAADPGAGAFSGKSREILRVGQFAPMHNVGTIAFNPVAGEADEDFGLLYAGFGDGGGAHDPRRHAQNTSTPLGAILRIDPLGEGGAGGYGIPPGNPLVGTGRGLPEIWAWGLRHPQHFSWAPDGTMFIADIGQDQVEEVNIGLPGNYGWPLREGTFATAMSGAGPDTGSVYPRPGGPDGLHYPVAQYDHDEGHAIGGGFVYAGSEIAALWGKFVFTELARGRLLHIDAAALAPNSTAPIREIRIRVDGRVAPLTEVAGHRDAYRPGLLRVDARLGQDSRGELYLLTKGDGWVRRLAGGAMLRSSNAEGPPHPPRRRDRPRRPLRLRLHAGGLLRWHRGLHKSRAGPPGIASGPGRRHPQDHRTRSAHGARDSGGRGTEVAQGGVPRALHREGGRGDDRQHVVPAGRGPGAPDASRRRPPGGGGDDQVPAPRRGRP